jgi:hypothetical protein
MQSAAMVAAVFDDQERNRNAIHQLPATAFGLKCGANSSDRTTCPIPQQSRRTVMSDKKRDIEILNGSLGGEYFGIAAYEAAIGTGLLDDAVRGVAEKFQDDHKQHAQRIRDAIIGLGGSPAEARSWESYASEFPPPPLKSQADVLEYAASLEQSGASGSVASVAQLSSPDLALLAASIAGVEAMHWSVLLGALGENPAPVSFIPLPSE